MMRLFGLPESEIAGTLRAAEVAGLSLGELEVTTCLRRGELEIATTYQPAAEPAYQELIEFIRGRHADYLFSLDGSTIDDQVIALLEGRSVAVAESCTGGLLAARLTERPGSSDYFAGGVVAYSNRAKEELAGVDQELIERHGAVSVEVAEALAQGAAERFHADIGMGITGVAGPAGGTPDKPVGFVCFSVCLRDGERSTRAARLPGGRVDVRDRSTTVALHLLRGLLLGDTTAELPGEGAAVGVAGGPGGAGGVQDSGRGGEADPGRSGRQGPGPGEGEDPGRSG